jgi:prophage maintenance system killer protein/prophage antirepressor-like protein
MENKLAVYQSKSGSIVVNLDQIQDTVWLSQADIVNLYEIDQSGVARHIKNILESEEVDVKSNMQKMHIASSDKPIMLYSLDVILAIGYRANSSKAINFRKWATSTLKSYVTDGFVLNAELINHNYVKFSDALDKIKLLNSSGALKNEDEIELIRQFAQTWLSLDAYDKSNLPEAGSSKAQVDITADELVGAISELKKELISKDEATELFAAERTKGGLESIVANVFQSFGGEDVYPSNEEKAAHLLYFVVKNHVFVDGNKRSGAFAFIWFLSKCGLLRPEKITPETLTTLTLLLAESDPKNMQQMIGLVLLLLQNK